MSSTLGLMKKPGASVFSMGNFLYRKFDELVNTTMVVDNYGMYDKYMNNFIARGPVDGLGNKRASKHIACAAFYDGDPWDLVLDRSLATRALPIFTMLTICATGSEMNPGAVISNEDTKEKLEINLPMLYPTLSVCDPTYLYTLPPSQTAAGTADIISHIFEQYF